MKKENILYVVKIVLPLLLICVGVVAVLAAVNALTEPVIAKNTQDRFDNDMIVFFKDKVQTEKIEKPFGESVKAAYKATKDGALAGYVFEVTGSGAYKGKIEVLIAIGPDGKILGISNVKNGETPSIGGKVLEDGGIKDNYVGASADALPTGEQAFRSGATRTSTALQNAVNNAFNAYNVIKESEGGNV